MNVDVLAIGAHPDDVEAGAGGTIAILSKKGYRAGILDLSRGELASRGTIEERDAEAEAAARLLGAVTRINAGLPDGAIENTPAQRREVAAHIRATRPRLIIAPMSDDRHPDHAASHYLVRDANFVAGLAKAEIPHEAWRAAKLAYYRVHGVHAAPQVVIDISEGFETKLAAMKAYASQFYNPDYEGAPTYVASREFWESVETRASYWGHQIGVKYGEPLFLDGPLGMTAPPGIEE